MGKTPKKLRLKILVDREWAHHPEIDKLREQGHGIEILESGYTWPDPQEDGNTRPDLILSRSSHMWNDSMWGLLDLPLKAARERKKGLKSDSQE